MVCMHFDQSTLDLEETVEEFTSSESRVVKNSPQREGVDMARVATVIMGGGQGTRLFPLTKFRCKPAMCFGGHYRLIDIPISNAINSGSRQIYVLSQFLARTLHQHVLSTYRMDSFSRGFVEVLPAEENVKGKSWFKGTADAVRHHLHYMLETPAEYFLILSGDQLYQFDFSKLTDFAKKTNADLVVAAIKIDEEKAKRMGVLTVDEHFQITDFHEKPQRVRDLKRMKGSLNQFLGSMGIYLFKRNALVDLLAKDEREDFGKHIIPTKVAQGGTFAYVFEGYWEDIGTIASFYEANMALINPVPPLDYYSETWPIYSHQTTLPGALIGDTAIRRSILCEGGVLEADEITHSIIGPRSFIGKGSIIQDSYVMGSDYFKTHTFSTLPNERFAIGENCLIKKAIIDKHVWIGDGVQLINKNGLTEYDSEHVYIRDGIIVVPRGANIPEGFIL